MVGMKMDEMISQETKVVEETKVVKVATQVISCKVCSAELASFYDARQHVAEKHYTKPRESNGHLYFESETQLEIFLYLRFEYDEYEWDGPGWYGVSAYPNMDGDGDNHNVFRHINELILEQHDRIRSSTDYLETLNRLKETP